MCVGDDLYWSDEPYLTFVSQVPTTYAAITTSTKLIRLPEAATVLLYRVQSDMRASPGTSTSNSVSRISMEGEAEACRSGGSQWLWEMAVEVTGA